MIVKKIESTRQSGKPKQWSINDLVDYIRAPERVNPEEKVVLSGSRGFLSETHAGQKAEMISLAQAKPKSPMPVQHWIFSWHEGEQPNEEQINQAVDIFQKEMELEGHQLVFGVHADTDNWHLHIAVNRVHPESLKVIKPNKGFDKEAAHKVIAKIEFLQGWQREKNSRYECSEDGEVAKVTVEAERKKISQKATDFEDATGAKSAETIAQEKCLSIIKKAKTWAELHANLEAVGMQFAQKGSGAVIFVGDTAIKASSVGRDCSLKALEKKLGFFEKKQESNEDERRYFEHKPYPLQVGSLAGNRMRKLSSCHLACHGSGETKDILSINARPDRRRVEVMRRDSNTPTEPISGVNRPEWEIYIAEREQYKKHTKIYRDHLELVKSRQAQERKDLSMAQAQERKDKLAGNWTGRGPTLNVLRSILATEQALAKQLLRGRHRLSLVQERDWFRQAVPVFPRFQEWLEDRGEKDKAEAWRYRRQPAEAEPGQDVPSEVKSVPKGIQNFAHYTVSARGHVHYSSHYGHPAAFSDVGCKLVIHAETDRDAILAALQLATQKWGTVKLNGSDTYKQLCVQVAAEHGLRLVNPELQGALTQEKARILAERRQQVPTEQEKAFEAYHSAVGADRYRVTCIKMFDDGGKKTFILDKQSGVTKGFTPANLKKKFAEMLRLQGRGENIYYTPLSEAKHHILIDDMDRSKLERLIAGGYQPAALLESSPGNYQAIITISKLGTEHDNDVGNRITEQLNREYGDAKLSGCIHPHRAPAFQNRKPQHQRQDGGFPQVKILKSESRECLKALEQSRRINAEYVKLASEREKRKKEEQPNRLFGKPGSPVGAYYNHLDNIKQNMVINDASRVDSMIALRMRATGHSQEAVADAIQQCAENWRGKDENRNWAQYAERTAKYAFGLAGDRDLQRNEGYKNHWMKIEGREDEEQQQQKLSRRMK